MSQTKIPFAVLIMHLGGETTCGDQKRNVDVFNFGGASCLANTDVGKKIDWQNLHPVYSVDHLLRGNKYVDINLKFRWWTVSEDKLTAKRNFKFGVNIFLSKQMGHPVGSL